MGSRLGTRERSSRAYSVASERSPAWLGREEASYGLGPRATRERGEMRAGPRCGSAPRGG